MPVFIMINSISGAFREFGSAREEPRLSGAGPLSDDGAGSLWCSTAAGAIVKVDPSRKSYMVVAELPAPVLAVIPVNENPRHLVPDGRGYVWSTTERGTRGAGSIFKVHIQTGALQVVAEFDPTFQSESIELGELTADTRGFFWVASRDGTVRKVNIETGEVQVVSTPQDGEGIVAARRLLHDGADHIWGTFAAYAGPGVFRIDTRDNAVETVALFAPAQTANDGLFPGAALVSGKDGNLWGVATERPSPDYGQDTGRFGFIYTVNPTTWTPQTFVRFTGPSGGTPGRYPVGPLTADGLGRLWGTASIHISDPPEHFHFVFRIDPESREFRRVAALPSDQSVVEPLVYDPPRSLWGLTPERMIFRVDTETEEVTLFPAEDRLLSLPHTPLVSTGNGQLWGARARPNSFGGSIFNFDTTTLQLTSVHLFGADGGFPHSLIADQKGNLWGTLGVAPGGAIPLQPDPQPGAGAVFKLNAASGRVQILHTFSGISQRKAGVVTSPLAADDSGDFYGTTPLGGARGFGTIFRFNRSRMETLFEFTGMNLPVPGAHPDPRIPLVRHIDGNFYGNTLEGGVGRDGRPAGAGQFFRLRFGPTPITGEALVTATGATLRGTVNPNGAATVVAFEYGTDSSLTTFATVSAGELPAVSEARSVSAVISDLFPDTSYYFRVVAQNAENPVAQRAADSKFLTPRP